MKIINAQLILLTVGPVALLDSLNLSASRHIQKYNNRSIILGERYYAKTAVGVAGDPPL